MKDHEQYRCEEQCILDVTLKTEIIVPIGVLNVVPLLKSPILGGNFGFFAGPLFERGARLIWALEYVVQRSEELAHRLPLPVQTYEDHFAVMLGRLGRGWGGQKSPNFPPKIGLLRGSLAILRGDLAYPTWARTLLKMRL